MNWDCIFLLLKRVQMILHGAFVSLLMCVFQVEKGCFDSWRDRWNQTLHSGILLLQKFEDKNL